MLMFLVLVLVTFGVCTINLSSLNLTENELHLLYVSDDADFSQDKSAKEKSDEAEEALDFDFEKDAESMTNVESTAEKDAWDKDFVYETLKTGGDETGFVIYSKGSDNKGTFSNSEFKNGAIGIMGK